MKYDYDEAWGNVYGDIQRFGPTHRHLNRILSRMLKGIDYNSVLDVGCGPGLNLPLLLRGKNVDRVAGIDISSKAISLARDRWSGEFEVLDIQRGHLKSKYDLVFCSLLLEHLPEDEGAITNLYEMTGRFLLVATMGGHYKRYEPWEKMVGHVRNYSPGELQAKLTGAGFAIRECVQWGFPFYSPLARLLQNINPNVGVGRYSTATKAVTTFLYWLYFFNSSRRGDLLVALAQV